MPHKSLDERREYARQWRAKHADKLRRKSRARYAANIGANRAYQRRWAHANKDSILATRRKHAGLPLAPYPAPAVCECCGKPPGRRRMNLDHDHASGKFRGWLCARCNSAIGLLGDCTEGVARAMRYLNGK